jgi:hypothetical protein
VFVFALAVGDDDPPPPPEAVMLPVKPVAPGVLTVTVATEFTGTLTVVPAPTVTEFPEEPAEPELNITGPTVTEDATGFPAPP